jgi:peptidase M49-like protein
MSRLIAALACTALLSACGEAPPPASTAAETGAAPASATSEDLAPVRPEIYATVRLSADLSGLSDGQREMIGLMIEAGTIMDELFWQQAYGDRDALLAAIEDPAMRRFAEINYGPWDRLAGNAPFVPGVGPKPLGANLYPQDMSRAEYEAADLDDGDGLYSVIRRDATGELMVVPYHEAFAEPLARAAELLRQAAALAEDAGFRHYLELRADALLTGEYFDSDMAWMDMRSNPIDLVYGPIESYEDQLFGYRASFEAYVLIKDMAWSERLARFAEFMPELQQGLPVPAEYRAETPGTDADLNAYDVVYYAGDCNAGSKTIAINLPNDERVQLERGTRRLQLKNAMRAKFDQILLPIAEVLVDPSQRDRVTFDAFFANTMFHEVAHGLGIKNVLDGSGTVRQALREHASALEEGKADILGLYMITQLHERGELDGELEDYYITFMAGIFRSVRFGASSAHGRANMIRFNFFRDMGAFARDPETGYYQVDMVRMRDAMTELSRLLLTLQGDGDYAGAGNLLAGSGVIGEDLQVDLDRLNQAGIPVDIVFDQGVDALGL